MQLDSPTIALIFLVAILWFGYPSSHYNHVYVQSAGKLNFFCFIYRINDYLDGLG